MTDRPRTLPFSLAATRAPPGFEVRGMTIPAGSQRPFPGDWCAALIVVEDGELEVECALGSQAIFRPGAMLCFAKVRVTWLRNCTSQPVVLAAFLTAGSA